MAEEAITNFVREYFAQSDADRSQVSRFFADDVQVTLMGRPFVGKETVQGLLNSMTHVATHTFNTIDTQTCGDGFLALVQGVVTRDGNAQNFTDQFFVKPHEGSFLIHNLIVRIQE